MFVEKYAHASYPVHCPRCGKVIAEPKELIDFWKTQEKYLD